MVDALKAPNFYETRQGPWSRADIDPLPEWLSRPFVMSAEILLNAIVGVLELNNDNLLKFL